MADSGNLGNLDSQDWQRLQDLASRFERACQANETVDLDTFLPQAGPLRRRGSGSAPRSGTERKR